MGKGYNRQKAVDYAHRWAFGRNPAYYNFDKLGGDCTNFISQCLFAGTGVMNYTPTYGWYYNSVSSRSPSWTGVQYLYNFLTKGGSPGPHGVPCGLEQVEPGDIIQLSFNGKGYTHSLIVVDTGTVPQPEDVLVATHTQDSDNRPLSSYKYILYRCIHINV